MLRGVWASFCKPAKLFLRPREAVAFIGVFSSDGARRGGSWPGVEAAQRVKSPRRSAAARKVRGAARSQLL